MLVGWSYSKNKGLRKKKDEQGMRKLAAKAQGLDVTIVYMKPN